MNLHLKLAAAVALVSTATAFADIKLNDNLTLGGYAAGSYVYIDPNPGASSDSLFNGAKGTPSADALKTIFTANFKPVTGVISLYYIPNIPPAVMKNELTVLDAFVSYDAGGGFTVTGGKFLSYLGYEAFDTPNMSQITYGAVTVGTLAGIPAYHSGVKVDFANDAVGCGLAVLDSVYSPNGIDKGDGELKDNIGFEGYVTSKGLGALTLWAGFAYDTKGGFQADKVLTLDFWAQYQLSPTTTIAGEYLHKNGGSAAKGSTWLAYLNQGLSDKVSVVLRVSGERLDSSTKTLTGAQDFTQYTIGPSLKVTDNLVVRAEYSYYGYKGGPLSSKELYGLQGVFKF